MFKKGSRVRCLALGHPRFEELGTIVVCSGRKFKVLFDADRVEGRIDTGQNLALARWLFDLDITADYGLEFNDDLYAIATPAFWEAWHANGKKVGMYAPARVPASAIELPGDHLVWIVFVSGDVRRGFLDALHTSRKM